MLASLPGLPIGTAWFWPLGWLGVLKRLAIRQRRTFDSSRTPAVAARAVTPQKVAPVDLDALRERISATIERAKAEDPHELRKRIAELERELAAAKATRQAERVEVPAVSADDPARFRGRGRERPSRSRAA